MCSHYNGRQELDLLRYQPENTSPPRVRFNPEQRQASGATSSFGEAGRADIEAHTELRIPEDDPQSPHQATELPSSYFVLQMQQNLFGFFFEVQNKTPPQSPHSSGRPPYILLKPGDLRRWQRASEAVVRYFTYEEAGQGFIDFLAREPRGSQLNPDLVPDLLAKRTYNWKIELNKPSRIRERDWRTGLAFIWANLLYGLLHLLPIFFNKPFHSRIERVVWLVASIGLCGIGWFVWYMVGPKYLLNIQLKVARMLPAMLEHCAADLLEGNLKIWENI